jgi:hypothetical protein
MYRDTFRAICLNALGRTLSDAGDRDGAHGGLHQSALHLGGRPRTWAGGWLLADALGGLGREDEARRPPRSRDRGDWSWFWGQAPLFLNGA